MAVFKIIHISDLHFGAEPKQANVYAFADAEQRWTRREVFGAVRRLHKQGTHDPFLAERVARLLLRNAKDQSLLVISGDLAATGLVPDLEAALAFLEGRASHRMPYLTMEGQATLSAGNFGLMVMPGNHDRYRNHLGAAGGVNFDVTFARHWGRPNTRIGRRVLRHPRGMERLAFLAADFCLASDADAEVPQITNRYGQGRATQALVRALEDETQQVRADHEGVGVCWTIHFPTTLSGTRAGNPMALLDARLVIEAAKRRGVGLVLSGHLHESVMLFDDGVQLCCAGSATYYKEPNGNFVHFLEIDVTNGCVTLIGKRDFEWDPDAEDFVERPTGSGGLPTPP